ncbi:hypothetical protein BS47DRAFT_1480977 [Hydnum rufescens UP504]|uniref:Uncharacterized protein n=1 Tax=Hydnum rufescens UP504 TaxID=1448309 RepID=A0A9P6BBH3_9AGAM|nr:hypothetical protein BS47DRAFT_1480977 [Hydnum rufescens UP504]
MRDFEKAIKLFHDCEATQLEVNLQGLGLKLRNLKTLFEITKNPAGGLWFFVETSDGTRGRFPDPCFLASDLILYVNDLVADALKDHGRSYDKPILVPALVNDEILNMNLTFVYCHIDPILAWHQIDRWIEEAYEVLWSFHAANAVLDATYDDRVAMLVTQLSKRAIRKTPEDEFASFPRWVGRVPIPIHIGYGNRCVPGVPSFFLSMGNDDSPSF